MAIRLPHSLLALAIAFASTGCATKGYFADRARDASDIATMTIGAGAGVKARVGPIQLAVLENCDILGLRAGACFWEGLDLIANSEIYLLPFPMRGVSMRGWGLPYGLEEFSHGSRSASSLRRKDVAGVSPLPGFVRGSHAPFYSQVEVVAGLGLTVRLGLNPGEALDFLLGWLGLDLYGDDLSRRPALPAAPKPSPIIPSQGVREGTRPLRTKALPVIR